jgi:dipeptidyl aminopeptidase/acylaminoacyl peptidase
MFRSLPAAALSLLAVATAPFAAWSLESIPYTVDDQVRMARVTDPQLSPDGRLVAFQLRSTDYDNNRGTYDLWLAATDGSNVRQLTQHQASDTNPRWAPDGRSLFFLSTRSGSSQVHRIPLDGGEPQQVTSLPLDVSNLAVGPDGETLVFSLEVFPGTTYRETASKLEELSRSKVSGRVYDQLLYRHWDSWSDGRRNHLFVMKLGDEPRDLIKDFVADAPSRPFGGTEEFTFTPDGKALIFTCRNVGREEAWSTNLDLYYVPLDGSAAPRNFTAGNTATDTQPTFSSDGRQLAYLAMTRPGFEADRMKVMVRDWASGKDRELAPNWDRSPDAIAWSLDGRTIFAAAHDLGQKPLFAIDVATGAVRKLVGPGQVEGFSIGSGSVVYGLQSLTAPTDLWVAKLDGSAARQITRVNAAALARIRFGEPEQLSFKGWNDETVHAWIVKPVNLDPNRRYPVAFLIHGGPQGSFGNDFHYRWNPQVYAGHGYAAVMIDFHGSTGYGQAFTDSIRGDWGGKPFEDLQKGLAAVLARYPWMDGERVCALGASYGGFMVNWIAGNWPDRFRCLVNHDGNLDERFAYFDTEELWFPEWEHGGPPWDTAADYRTHNPIDHVEKWKTPMLVIHGGKDFRVVETQGMATFTALQRRGVPSKFLHFPDENHWVLKPQNSVFWHQTVLEWLDQWTR